MKRQLATRAVALAGTMVLLAACGGGESGPTKAEFITAADKICDKADKKLDVILERDVEDFSDMKRLTTDAGRIGDALLKDLRAIEVPKGEEEDVEEVFGGIEKQVRVIRQLGKAAEDEDQDKIDEIIEEGDDLEADVEKSAKRYGFKTCGVDDEDDKDDAKADGKSGSSDDEKAAADEEPAADDGLPAGSLEIDEVEEILSESVEFTAAGRSTLAKGSDPTTRDAKAYETEDGSATFELLTYDSPEDAIEAEPGISKAAQAGGFVTVSFGKNVILVTAGTDEDDTTTAEAIADVFSKDIIQG